MRPTKQVQCNLKMATVITVAIFAYLAEAGSTIAQVHPTLANRTSLLNFDSCQLLYSSADNSGTGYKTHALKGPKSTSVQSFDSCQIRYGSASAFADNYLWKQAYDTAKSYVETCPNDYQSWRAFGVMNQAAQAIWGAHDTTIYLRYRSWLESVLYLNKTDPEYFCMCVEAIGGTFKYASDTTEQLLWKSLNRGLAVLRWLLGNTNCDTGMLKRYYTDSRISQHQQWENDTTVKLDTTLPSMHDLGLDSILNLHLGVGLAKSPYAGLLTTFSISTNPFTSTTTLLFSLDRMAYIKCEVYDELGRIVIGDGSGHVFDPGSHNIPINLKGFASGAYYLRISLGDGETKTIKMVKNE